MATALTDRWLREDGYYVVVGTEQASEDTYMVQFRVYEAYEVSAMDEKGFHREYQKPTGRYPDSTPVIEEAEVFCEGCLKWDGCMEFQFPKQPHVCGLDGLEGIHRALVTVYEIAPKVMPNADTELLGTQKPRGAGAAESLGAESRGRGGKGPE